MPSLSQKIAELLPDKPEFIDFLGLLQFKDRKIYGDEKNFILVSHTKKLACVYGKPEINLLRLAISPDSPIDILALPHSKEYLSTAFPQWRHETAILHEWQRVFPEEIPTGLTIRLLSQKEIEQIYGIDSTLKEELLNESENMEIGAVVVKGRPVCFCYANFLTEKYWDVSIDTLRNYRRKGYALACVKFMIEFHKNLKPAWGALASNQPSLKLANKLGFVPVAEQSLFLNPSKNTPIYMRSGL